MAKILIVASEFEPFRSSGIYRINFIKSYLEQQGHFVAVLTTNAEAQGLVTDKADDQQKHIYRAFSLSLLQRRLLSSRRLPIYPKFARAGKYDVWLPFATRKGKKLIKELAIDIVFTSFPDFASLAVAQRISQATGCQLFTEFRDPPYWIYDQTTVTPKVKYCQDIVAQTIAQSRQIIVCTENSKQSLKSYYNIEQDISVISNGYDAEVIAKLAEVERNPDCFEVVHIGSFYDQGRNIIPVVEALNSQAEHSLKSIKLRLIGDLPDKKTINKINLIATAIEVSIEPPVAMEQALLVAKQADALLLLQGSRFDKQIPTKVYEYLALNRPIWAVVGINGATHQLLIDYSDNVIVSDYNDVGSIEQGAVTAFSFQAQLVDCSQLSRQAQVELLNTLI